jgi:hypothetical protein
MKYYDIIIIIILFTIIFYVRFIHISEINNNKCNEDFIITPSDNFEINNCEEIV